MSERQVKIPYDLYRDLVRYFLGSPYEEPWEEVESRIKTGLRAKQEASERRMMYAARLTVERESKS